jgi:glycosyltransferase involved in cell wall biosynthesis
VRQVARFLGARGYAVAFDLRREVDAIILVDPRVGGLVEFGPDEIGAYKRRRPGVFCLHRVNENDQRKGTTHVDGLLAGANRVADHTVFISGWLRDYHAERWFDRARPHSVITNGADAAIYHPIGGAVMAAAAPMRLVTHHWSDNWNKGFAVYQEIDRLIAEGLLKDVTLTIVGRWPKEIRWRTATTVGPRRGARLAALLRSAHVYVTASAWEPGGMHFIEAAQCGLPVLYHADGGGIVEVARRFGIAFREDVGSAIEQVRQEYPTLRQAVLQDAPSGDAMSLAYAALVQRGIVRQRSPM